MAQVNYFGDFPWCPVIAINQQLGEGTSYPIGLNLVEMEALYWRIKSFSVSVTSSVDEGLPNGDFTNVGTSTETGFMYSGGSQFYTGYTSETDLVCGGLWFTPYGYWNGGSTNISNNINMLAGGIGTNGGVHWPTFYYNGLYYPFIHFEGQMGPWTTSKLGEIKNKVVLTGSVNIVSNYFNRSIPIYNQWSPSLMNSPNYHANTSTIVTLTANYWPYNP